MTQRSNTSPFTASAARVLASLVVCGSVVGWSTAALAQGASNSTVTTSTSSQTSFESPTACNPVGSSRSVQTITLEDSIGPATIIIGNRDNVIPTPPGGCVDTQVLLPADTVSGRCYRVIAGTTNVNVNIHTQTFQCVAAVVAAAPVPVPLLPWPALLLLGNLVAGLGVWQLVRRRKTE